MTDYKELSNTEINKLVMKKLGLCWHTIVTRDEAGYHCSCGKVWRYLSTCCPNPDFCSNAKTLIEELKKIDDWHGFAAKTFHHFFYDAEYDYSIPMDYVTDPRQLAIEFLEWEK